MNDIKIRHFLADGQEVDSIEGRVIPNAGQTAAVYRIMMEHMKTCAGDEEEMDDELIETIA